MEGIMDSELKERLDRLDNQHKELIAQHEDLIRAVRLLSDLLQSEEKG
jgi:hypothetical protein